MPTVSTSRSLSWACTCCSKPGPLADSLFFFSKVMLLHVARELQDRGVKVAIARVEKQTNATAKAAPKKARKKTSGKGAA